MNTTSSLNKAREELERAKKKAAADANAAQLARKVARAAKLRLKQARKLSKVVRKSARRADAKSEESSEALDSAQAKVEKLRKRLRKEQHKAGVRRAPGARRPASNMVKKHPARLARRSKVPQKGAPKQKVARGKGRLPHSRPKSKLTENTKTPTPREPRVEPRRRTKVTPTTPPSATAPKPNPILPTGQNPGDQEPLHAPDVDAPAAAG